MFDPGNSRIKPLDDLGRIVQIPIMASSVRHLHKLGLLSPGTPDWVISNSMYEVIMGSVAYGVSNDMSDMDVYGWTIPPQDMIFPWMAGEVPGFGTQKQRFDQFQQHHIRDTGKNRVYDLSIYNIVRYFHLCMENNPNMLDSLFVPQRCILHMAPIAQMVRDRRREFLHKGAFHKLKGYAFSQLSKMDVKKQNVPEVHIVRAIEDQHGIDHRITIDEVQAELARRNLKPRLGSI